MTRQERNKAIQNAIPQKPIRVELGGGYYYRCHWLKCDNTVHPWERYCSQCGQRLTFDEYYVDDFEKLFYEDK